MTRATLLAIAGLLLFGAVASADGPDLYDYAARQQMAASARQARDYPAALFHSLWLAWLAPQPYRQAAEPVLRDRDLRRRAHRASGEEPVPEVLEAALQANQSITDTCLNGAVAQQAERLAQDVSALVRQAEGAYAERKAEDPVGRMALASLYLAWDDALRLQRDPDLSRDRASVLRQAATEAEAAAHLVPDAPGPYRVDAIIRSRLADVSSDPDQWAAAIDAGAHAAQLDPKDAFLPELLWGLNLRAGRWDEARRWETTLRQLLASQKPGTGSPKHPAPASSSRRSR